MDKKCNNCILKELFETKDIKGKEQTSKALIDILTDCNKPCNLKEKASRLHPRFLTQFSLIKNYQLQQQEKGRHLNLEDAAKEWIHNYAEQFSKIYPPSKIYISKEFYLKLKKELLD